MPCPAFTQFDQRRPMPDNHEKQRNLKRLSKLISRKRNRQPLGEGVSFPSACRARIRESNRFPYSSKIKNDFWQMQ
jgi:hypothetical protein